MSPAEIAALHASVLDLGQRMARVEAAMLTMPKLLAALGSVATIGGFLVLLIKEVG